MKYSSLIKKLKLSQDAFDEIKEAVVRAEEKTSGEIALAMSAESSSYAFWELLTASVTSMVFLLCLLPLADQIDTWLKSLFWGNSSWYLVAFFILAASLMILVFYLLYNIPAIDSLVIPSGAKRAAVTRRAMRHFAESGVYCTSGHSGILIYFSCLERQVRILADEGISNKISHDMWNLIADGIAENMAKGNVKEACLDAIQKCGELLAENFPSQGLRKNELCDGLVILEDEKWA